MTDEEVEALAESLLEKAPANVLHYVRDTVDKWRLNPDRPDLVTHYLRHVVAEGLERRRYVPGACPECGSWCHYGYDLDDVERIWPAELVLEAMDRVGEWEPTCLLGGTYADAVADVLHARDEIGWMQRCER